MINGDLPTFLDKLYWLEDLSVVFRGKEYLVHGYGNVLEDGQKNCHLEVLELENDSAKATTFACDAPTPLECVRQFREALIWEGMCFDAAESSIEWIG